MLHTCLCFYILEIDNFIEIDLKAAKKNFVPKANEQARMVSFFSCVATLMQSCLLELFYDSLQEYMDFACLRMVS